MSVKNKRDLSKFVRCVTEKNYSEANKYLQAVLEKRFSDRMKRAAKKPLF